MFFIILLGFLLRISYIIKPEGMWNDEYVSWYVASTPLFDGFRHEVLRQCHMPLYYIYLKPFAHFSDTILRLTSVIPGVLAIPVMYLIGKEYSKKAGYFAATITSVLSFLVYYSQEVRFYSLLFLFSALALLFTIRYLKDGSKLNLAGYLASLALILFTHIIGVIYVFFSLLYVAYKKKKLRAFVLSVLAIVLLLSPIINNVLRMLPASQWWGQFSYTNILFLFSDYFSPILTNNITAPPVFFYDKSLALWLVVPTLIAFSGMIAGGVNEGKNVGILFVATSTVTVMSLLAATEKLVFITKYSIEILPILILFTALGFVRLKKIGLILLSIFVSFHLAAIFTPNYVTELKRNEGHKIVGDILNARNSKTIVFTYYEPDRFYRYTNVEDKNLLFISKSNRHLYKDNPAEILDAVSVGESVSVVILDSVSFLDKVPEGANVPEMFLTFSNVKKSLIKRLNSDFKGFKVDKGGYWTVVTAVRFK